METQLEGMIMKLARHEALIELAFHYSIDETANESDKLHIWLLDLDKTTFEPSACTLLSSDELQRVARLKDPVNRRRALNRFILTRNILAKILGDAPRNLAFSYGQHGKPRIAVKRNLVLDNTVNFNLSHSQNVFALAIAQKREVGIDIEVVERTGNSSFDYFNWTAKEAIAKLTGVGLVELEETAPNLGSYKTRVIQLNFCGKKAVLAVAVT